MERWSDLLGRIDRRILYVGLVVITLLPLVFHWSLPLYPSPHAIRFYQTVESLPTDKLVVVSTDWGPSEGIFPSGLYIASWFCSAVT